MSVQAISWVLEQSEAKLASRLVLLSIANHAQPDGTGAFPAVPTMAKEAHISDRQVQRCLRELVAIGELTVHEGLGPKGTHYFVMKGFIRPHCWYCGKDMFMTSDVTIDHQLPISRGGNHDLKNLVYCCSHCNATKATKTVEEFRTPGRVFFGETDAGRQFVTRPDPRTAKYRVTKRPLRGDTQVTPPVTNQAAVAPQMSPEPSGTTLQPSSEPGADRATARGGCLNEGWKPNDDDVRWAIGRGFTESEVTDHSARFLAHYTTGNGRRKTHVVWSEATRNGHGGFTAWQSWMARETPKPAPARVRQLPPVNIENRRKGNWVFDSNGKMVQRS